MTRASSAWVALLAVALAAICGATPAEAALKLCNRTSYILYAATGMAAANGVATKGWTRIVPGACKIAIKGDLGTAPVYVYARTSQAHSGPARAWGGSKMLCTADTDFALDAPAAGDRCPTDNAYHMPFAQIENKGAASWTTTFTQSPPLKTDADARAAGLARLLADNGYKKLPPDSKAFAVELDRFRVRMKMPQNADAADFFDALETEALKTATPNGYSVCNDTNAAVWAALGEHDGKIWRARGWWNVMPGACARPITRPLSADKIYLLVEGKGAHLIVTGQEHFCVTRIVFDVEGRSRCAERGLVSRGFAVTDTKGRTGYTAHISEDGLLPTLRLSN